MKRFFSKILDFIAGEIGILILSIFVSLFVILFMWIIIHENGVITIETVKVYDVISDVYITCRDVNNPWGGFVIDITDLSGECWNFYNCAGSLVVAFVSFVLFLLFTAWNIISGIINGVYDLLYGNDMKKEIFEEFKTPEYDVVLRTSMLYDSVSIKEIQKKLIKVKEEKEKNKDNLEEVNENLIFSNIDENDELYKLVMNYKWTINEEKEQKQFEEIHRLMNKRMREHGLLKRYIINDFLMMFCTEKIDKEEFISWSKRIIIEIVVILFTLKLSQLISEVLWKTISVVVIFYVFGRMICVPYTKKYHEERKKINIYNSIYNEKWSK